MREIRFRGKDLETGEWIEGTGIFWFPQYGDGVEDKYYIIPLPHTVWYDDKRRKWKLWGIEIDPKTIEIHIEEE